MWADVLGAPIEGDNPSFFEVGGESITAMTLIFRVQEAFGVTLDVGNLFEAPNLKDFSRAGCTPTAHDRRRGGPRSGWAAGPGPAGR